MSQLDTLLAALFKQLHKLLDIEERLISKTKEQQNMDQTLTDLIAAFDAATDRIAARIAKLIAQGDLSPAAKTALQAEVDKLNALGKDPDAPVPPTT